jgi:hypothetical protein
MIASGGSNGPRTDRVQAATPTNTGLYRRPGAVWAATLVLSVFCRERQPSFFTRTKLKRVMSQTPSRCSIGGVAIAAARSIHQRQDDETKCVARDRAQILERLIAASRRRSHDDPIL